MNKLIGILMVGISIWMFIDHEFIIGNIMLHNLEGFRRYIFPGLEGMLGLYFMYYGFKNNN